MQDDASEEAAGDTKEDLSKAPEADSNKNDAQNDAPTEEVQQPMQDDVSEEASGDKQEEAPEEAEADRNTSDVPQENKEESTDHNTVADDQADQQSKVVSIETLQPTQVEQMITKSDTDEWDLTMFTCNTGGGRTRCTVRCVEE